MPVAMYRLLLMGVVTVALMGRAVLPHPDERRVSSAVTPDRPGVLNRAIGRSARRTSGFRIFTRWAAPWTPLPRVCS